MKRSICTLAGLALMVVGTACSMCQNPFDYTSPVQGHGGSPYYGSDVREGTNLSGGPVVSEGVESAAAPQPTPARSTAR